MDRSNARLLVVADHPLTRHGVRAAVLGTPLVVGFAGGRHDATQSICAFAPDAVLVDARLDGLEIDRLADAATAAPDARRLLLTNRLQPARLDVAFAAGAQVVVARSLATVALGEVLCQAAEQTGPLVHGAVIAAERPQLTGRERLVQALVEDGHTNDQIARRLAMDEDQVKSYRATTHAKLQV